MIDVRALVQERIAGAMAAPQARLDSISQKTGLPFSSYYVRSLSTGIAVSPAVGEDETAVPADASVKTEYASPSEYDGLIAQASLRYGVDEMLVRAVVFSESGFRNNVTSGAGAMGLMQLMPYTAEALGVTDPYDPAQNIDGGVRLLSSLLSRFGGDARLAVAAYNCGAGGVVSRGITDLSDASQRSRLPSETQGYLTRIESYLAGLGALSSLTGVTGSA